ncbi:MAG: oligosaccharide flippase family protein [Anaeromyxobacter sp.]
MESAEVTPELTDAAPRSVVARNAFHLVLGQAASTALAIMLSAMLGRQLGAHGFGLYYIITTIGTFAFVFVEWGQPLFVIRAVATEPARGGALLGSSLALRVAFAAAVLGPSALTAWALGYDGETIGYALLFIGATLPFFLAQGFGMIFRAHDRMGADAAVSVINKVLILVVAWQLIAGGWGVPGLILALALAGFVALAMAAWVYHRMPAPRLSFSLQACREIVVGGAPIIAMTAAVYAQPYLDAAILSKLVPATAVVGWYGAARNILGTLIAPANILATASYPRLSRASGDPEQFRTAAREALRPMLFLGALGGAGTYLFAHVAVQLVYGQTGFEPAVDILQVFAPGLFLLFVDMLMSTVVYAAGGAKGFAVAKILSVAVSTGLDLLLVPFFQARYGNGGIGVVVAFALSEIVVFAGALRVIRRGTFGRGALLDAGRALAAAGLTVALFELVPTGPWFVGIPLCMLVFTLLAFALGLVKRHDLELLFAVGGWRLPWRKPGTSPGRSPLPEPGAGASRPPGARHAGTSRARVTPAAPPTAYVPGLPGAVCGGVVESGPGGAARMKTLLLMSLLLLTFIVPPLAARDPKPVRALRAMLILFTAFIALYATYVTFFHTRFFVPHR